MPSLRFTIRCGLALLFFVTRKMTRLVNSPVLAMAGLPLGGLADWRKPCPSGGDNDYWDAIKTRAGSQFTWAVEVLSLAIFLCSGLASATTPLNYRGPDVELIVDDKVLIRTRDGGTLSATIVRPIDATPLPTVLTLDIYTDPDRYLSKQRWLLDGSRRAAVCSCCSIPV